MFATEVSRRQWVPRRDAFIVERCRDKRVLHVGAADWPFTKEKYENGSLLYDRIAKVAREQRGVDSDKESVALLNSLQIPRSRALVHDLNTPLPDGEPFDVVICGETLEHLVNPGIFLESVRRSLAPDGELVVSVPNATVASAFIYALFGREAQHPDHSLAFTYKTIQALLRKSGWQVGEVYFSTLDADVARLNWRGKVVYWCNRVVGKLFPLLSQTLIVIARRIV